ncbi:MAG: methyltransferase domain-containing protein [Candidatus Ranarchaeia archaeon]
MNYKNPLNKWKGFVKFPHDVEPHLTKVYGDDLHSLSKALAYPPSPFVIRVNPSLGSRVDLVRALKKFDAVEMNWRSTPHAIALPWKGPNILEVTPQMKKITANIFAAESVMIGSHLYSPGVLRTPKVTYNEDIVITDPQNIPVALGKVARIKGTRGFTSREKGVFVNSTTSIFSLPPLNSLPEYTSGLLYSQSLPSMIAAQFAVAGISMGDTILDLCAAPGGKTTYMAQLASNHQIVAVDRSKNRLESMSNHITRLKLTNIKIIPTTVDRFLLSQPNIKVQRILLDPPCSALGLRPRLAYSMGSRSILSLANYQAQLLMDASNCLQSSGYLVYSTCTITQEENEANIRLLLAKDLYEEPTSLPTSLLRNDTIEEILTKHPNGVMIRFDPVKDHTPGHFIAVLKKKP